MKRGLAWLAVTVAAVPVVARTAAPADAGTRRERAVVYRLASNDGRWERSGADQWMVERGGRVSTFDAPPSASWDSGTVVDAPMGRVTAASLARAERRGTVSSSGVKSTRRVVVVPVEWPTAQWKPSDLTVVEGIVAELKPWWNTMSARQETLNVTVTSKVDLDGVLAAGTCDIETMMTRAQARASELGLTGADHYLVTFTGDSQDCAFGGLAAVGGQAAWAYAQQGYAGVWAHELGHNLGFNHGNTCWSGSTLTYMATCDDIEYGNSADVMGLGVGLKAYYAPEFLDSTGWLPAANRGSWSRTSQTFTIARADRTDAGVTAVRIDPVDPTAGDNGFWLQYNPNDLGHADAATRGANGGIVVTMDPSTTFSQNLMVGDGVIGNAKSTSYLCDITPSPTLPAMGDLSTDPRLFAGGSWTDPRNRFTITVVSTDGTNAVVRIDPIATTTVSAPTDLVVAPDETGISAADVTLAPGVASRGKNEPVTIDMTVVERPELTCSTTSFSPTCRFEGLARSVNYTVKATARNGTASAEYTTAAFNLSTSPPRVSATFVATDSTIIAKARVDDGGSPLSATPTLSLGADQVCALDPKVETTCTFLGLARRAEQKIVGRAANGLGPRETTFSPRTAAGTPDSPVISGAVSGADFLVTATPGPDDRTNIDYFYVECSGGGLKWTSTTTVTPTADPKAVVRIAGAKGKKLNCFAAGITLVARKFLRSPFAALRTSATGKVEVGKVTLTPTVKSAKKGLVTVSWKTKDSFGGKVIVNVKTSTKKCAKASATSCTVKGLTSGSTLYVVVTARGTSGSTTQRMPVVVA